MEMVVVGLLSFEGEFLNFDKHLNDLNLEHSRILVRLCDMNE